MERITVKARLDQNQLTKEALKCFGYNIPFEVDKFIRETVSNSLSEDILNNVEVFTGTGKDKLLKDYGEFSDSDLDTLCDKISEAKIVDMTVGSGFKYEADVNYMRYSADEDKEFYENKILKALLVFNPIDVKVTYNVDIELEEVQDLANEHTNECKNFYVTFGSDEEFPYQNGFLTISAENERQANEYFQALHPNRAGSDCLNYSFMYTEEEWKSIYPKYYEGTSPHETITEDMVKEILESKTISEQNRRDNR